MMKLELYHVSETFGVLVPTSCGPGIRHAPALQDSPCNDARDGEERSLGIRTAIIITGFPFEAIPAASEENNSSPTAC